MLSQHAVFIHMHALQLCLLQLCTFQSQKQLFICSHWRKKKGGELLSSTATLRYTANPCSAT